MPDQPELQPALEQDLHAISAEIARNREKPENKLLSGHELVRNSVKSYTAPVAPPPSAATAPAAQTDNDSVLPAYAQSASAETKQEVEHLLSLAFQEGVLSAAARAAKSSPYVLDIFHDALAGKLYPELKKRGLVD